MVTGTPTPLSQLPTGTIDNMQAIVPMDIGMPSLPQTIRASLLQVAQFLQSQGQMISGSYSLFDGRYDPTGTGHSFLSSAYIDGLNIIYITSGSIAIQSGAAFVPSLNRLVLVTGTITQSFPAISTTVSGSWQNVYLFENNGVPSIEITGTNPSNPYMGVAKTKSGDTSKRYIGSIYCDTGGYAFKFTSNVQGNIFKQNWLVNNSAFPFNVITGATGTSSVFIPYLVPITGTFCELLAQMVLDLAIGGDANFSIGDNIPSVAEVTFPSIAGELNAKFLNGSATTNEIAFLPPSYMKITGNTIQYSVLQNAGANSLRIRIKGVSIQR